MLDFKTLKKTMSSDNWTVKAYQHIDGKATMVEWATGMSHRHAKEVFARLRNTDQYSQITMKEAV